MTQDDVNHAVLDRPLHFVLSQLVCAAGREQVSDVWVAGKPELREHVLIDIDLDEVLAKAHVRHELIAGIAGLH